MNANVSWYVKTDEGKVYGPASDDKLLTWAQDGRIDPSSFISKDRISWLPAQMLPALEMKWLIETEPGKVFGPFNRAVAIRLFRENSVPPMAKAYCLHEFQIDQDPPPVEKIVEKIVEKEVIKEVPVEKIVEKIVEVPPPARTEMVVAEVLDPVADVPPIKSPGALFDNVGRSKLAALEAAARRELEAAERGGGARLFGFLGGKKQ